MSSPSLANSTMHRLIVNAQHHYVVWPVGRKVPDGWQVVGPPDAPAALKKQLQQMSVETQPAPFLMENGSALDTKWG